MTLVEEAEKMGLLEQQPVGAPSDLWSNRAQAVIDTFRSQRIGAAGLSRKVSHAERDRTVLRHKIVADLMAAGTGKTAAADQARLSPEYVEAGVKIEELQELWEIAMCESEHARMTFEVISMKVRDSYDAHQRATELKGMESTIKARIKELGG